MQFSHDDQVYINTSLTLPLGASKEAQKVWLSMEATINNIINNLDCSIFPCTQGGTGGAGGCDLVLIAKEVNKYTETDEWEADSDTGTDAGEGKGNTYHIS